MRRRQLIMNDWLFTQRDTKRPVDLPHTWNAIDGADGGNDYYRGCCTYEKTLRSPEYDKENELVYLEFDGVNASCEVILNGERVASHDGGYSTFRVDVTKQLQEENHLVVKVDNSVNERVYPQKADFTFYGGIYRDVNFLVVSKAHFALTKYGTPGIHVDSKVADDLARIDVKTFLSLKKDESDEYSLMYVLADSEGNVISQISSSVENDETENLVSFNLENPHLWNGKQDPYLYHMAGVLCKEGQVIDKVETDFGIRTIKVDPAKGFFLNGKLYPLRGVSRHQDRKGNGNAISYEMMKEDMELIKEVGANCIRLAHYQHSQYFYDLCDREGMIVWAEIPYISEYLSDGDENAHSQMIELITQNYNHPSIVTWGISNEITIGYRKSYGRNIENHKSLNDLVHDMDPSRPTSMACFAMCSPFHPVTFVPDIIGWNLYLGWYIPGFFLNDLFMSFFHLVRPRMALGYSEYGAEGMPNLHSAKPKRGDNTEEYQAKYHEYMLRCFERHPYLWSTFVWNMFDFAADARNQGGEPGMNHKGLVTYDRKIKKDSFYLYKAYWSDDPFVHICEQRFTYRNSKKMTVKVYSNQADVELFVDGKKVSAKLGDKVFTFEIMLNLDRPTTVKAVCGEHTSETQFIYTTEKHSEYILRNDKSKSTANWM